MMFSNLIIVFFLCSSCLTSELLNSLSKGSSCVRNGVPGKCVSIYNCLSSYIDLKTRDHAPICSFQDKEPDICCTDCNLYDTRKFVIDSNLGIIKKTGQISQDKCIEYMHRLDYPCKYDYNANITRRYDAEKKCHEVVVNVYTEVSRGGIGGTDAKRDEFPHMALLGYGADVLTAEWLCGGSVISERFILTAGHCLSSPISGQVKYVTLGILKRSDPRDIWQIYNVKGAIPHPEYKSPSKYHDIALLETDTEITFSRQVLPACLHATGEAGASMSALGWGALGYRKEPADTLQTVPVKRYEEDECSSFYAPHRHLKNGYNHTTQMCYGDKEEPKDTCEGDSGGPLQTFRNNYFDRISCIFTIVGVTSYGKPCDIIGAPGVYTRVIHYIPWIESIVWS